MSAEPHHRYDDIMAEDEGVQIDVQKVYDRLSGKIGRLEVENAQLLEGIEGLVKQLEALKAEASKAEAS